MCFIVIAINLQLLDVIFFKVSKSCNLGNYILKVLMRVSFAVATEVMNRLSPCSPRFCPRFGIVE